MTGAAGFVGSTLSARLLADGHEVVGIDNLSDYYDVNLKKRNIEQIASHPRFSLIEDDLNKTNINRLVGGIELVFHQAGQPGVRKSWGEDFRTYVDANIRATQSLLECLKESATLKRVVYASSSSIYGDAERYPTTEDDRPQPVSPYGVTKLAAEHLCSLYARNFGLPTVSLRYFTVYGPRQRPDMAFTRFIKAAVQGGKISVFGDGTQLRDFTYIDDVVSANIRCAEADVEPGRVYNVAGGGTTSVEEVLGILRELGGNFEVEYTGRVLGDVFQTGGSTKRIHDEVGWSAKISTREGIARQFAWGTNEFG